MARSSMANLITKVRSLINDPSGGSQIFADNDIQDMFDSVREDVRYELLTPGPSIVNAASTNNIASFVWADYYSQYKWWEDDVVIQGNNTATGAAYIVLTPVSSENFFGHWAFESNIFTAGTAPGQYPPLFATGKSHDVYATAALILDIWSAQYAASFDFSSDGQSFRRSQIIEGKQRLADIYRRRARAKGATTHRTDLQTPTGGHSEHVEMGWIRDKMAGDS
jgi:hypothetical protein